MLRAVQSTLDRMNHQLDLEQGAYPQAVFSGHIDKVVVKNYKARSGGRARKRQSPPAAASRRAPKRKQARPAAAQGSDAARRPQAARQRHDRQAPPEVSDDAIFQRIARRAGGRITRGIVSDMIADIRQRM
jgi:hypothetical protein